MTIKAKLYKDNKRTQINLSGSVDQIKVDHKTEFLVKVSKDGRKITLKPLVDAS